ncbi:MAG: hypothetical protein H0S85_15985 [Desulfovibrionaceae bacterium]|jgi:hypothetical protein|nr:hypothetical protein [Desulfovibrionaceae bacterium]
MSEIGLLAIAGAPIAAGVAVLLLARRKGGGRIHKVDFDRYKTQEIQKRGHYHKIVR